MGVCLCVKINVVILVSKMSFVQVMIGIVNLVVKTKANVVFTNKIKLQRSQIYPQERRESKWIMVLLLSMLVVDLVHAILIQTTILT